MLAGSRSLFEAVIVPHRSLTRHGLYYLIAVLWALSSLIMLRCWWLDAWPAVAFSGADVAITLLLVHLHLESAKRESEILLLSESGLVVRRTHRNGRSDEKVLPVAWLKVVLEERQGQVPALLLVAHGVHEEVARALGEDEKRDLAGALSAAFDRMRHPVFDNPQLVEPGAH
ncbi:MAG: DUF2244 domain-containing protein [Acetobacteraceae bacterium]